MRAHLAKFEVIQSNPDLCRMWAAVTSESVLKGRRMSPHDAWIAAAAIHLDASLATNNRKTFGTSTASNFCSLTRPATVPCGHMGPIVHN